MNRRKYPLSMFIIGVILELYRRWYILALTLFLLLIRIFMPDIPSVIPLILIVIWLVIAIIKQLIYRRNILNITGDKETNDLLDKMFIDNNKGYKNIIDVANESMDKNNNNNDL